jgi:uncharacterized protein (DUF362 family)
VHKIDGSKVALVKGSDPFETTTRALKLVRGDVAIQPDECVLIKPNCVRPVAPETGVTTDGRVVDAVIDFLMEAGIRDIVIAEGGNPGTAKAFRLTGLEEVAERRGVPLVNLNEDEWEEVPIPGAAALERVKIARTVLDSDRIINVPKLKVHHMAQVTLSLKNLMGVIADNRGRVMHHRLDEKIVDLASLFRPALNVVDGIVGAELDEVVGEPVRSNVVIAGVDMVSVDAVGSAVMGLDPNDIRHVQMAAERELGVARLDRIEVVGESIASVRTGFRTEYSDRKLETYGLKKPLLEGDEALMKASFANRDPRVDDPYRET